MSLETLPAFLLFAVVFYGTPGPATMSLAAAGSGHGFRRSLPYLAGIVAGLLVNLGVAATGLSVIISRVPALFGVLKYGSLLYIFYLAYRLAGSGTGPTNAGKPLRFHEGLLLNTLNPKAYLAAVAMFAQFGMPGEDHFNSLVMVAAGAAAVGTAVDIAWCSAGAALAGVFGSPRAARRLRVGLAILMVVSVLFAMLSSE